MVVVAHHDVSMQHPHATVRRPEQRRLKGFTTAPLGKEVLAVVPPADDVLQSPRQFNAFLARHDLTLPPSQTSNNAKNLGLTPLFACPLFAC